MTHREVTNMVDDLMPVHLPVIFRHVLNWQEAYLLKLYFMKLAIPSSRAYKNSLYAARTKMEILRRSIVDALIVSVEDGELDAQTHFPAAVKWLCNCFQRKYLEWGSWKTGMGTDAGQGTAGQHVGNGQELY